MADVRARICCLLSGGRDYGLTERWRACLSFSLSLSISLSLSYDGDAPAASGQGRRGSGATYRYGCECVRPCRRRRAGAPAHVGGLVGCAVKAKEEIFAELVAAHPTSIGKALSSKER